MWKSHSRDKSAKKATKVHTTDDRPHGLLMFGSGDKYLSPDFLHLSVEMVRNLQGKMVAGGNHFVQQDEPEAVNLAMRNFLAQELK